MFSQVCVCSTFGGVPHPRSGWWGATPSQVWMGGYPIPGLDGGGVPRVPPHHDWLGYPPGPDWMVGGTQGTTHDWTEYPQARSGWWGDTQVPPTMTGWGKPPPPTITGWGTPRS